jgi:hypothetical protein
MQPRNSTSQFYKLGDNQHCSSSESFAAKRITYDAATAANITDGTE